MGVDPSMKHLETPSTGIFAGHCGFVVIDGTMVDNLLRLHRGAVIILAAGHVTFTSYTNPNKYNASQDYYVQYISYINIYSGIVTMPFNYI